jgi:hypothetical protein
MKMIPGSGTIANYSSWVYNCTTNQMNYKIPVNSLQDVQLYIDIGESSPGAISYELIHTCGPTGGTIETLTTSAYVVGQDTNERYYGVFKNFNENTTATCFVIAITLDGQIYFSQEYCVEPSCNTLVNIVGCYGNLDPLISYDREGIYFGQSQGGTLGDATVVYEHRALMRLVEITVQSIKNTFKKGRTRNFRVESEDISLLWAEPIPEWYLKHVDAIFKRGEVFIGDTKYLVNETGYEKMDECLKNWKPSVTLTESYFQSFSCEADPCTVVTESGGGGGGTTSCCDPAVTNASVEFTEGNNVTINFVPCSPTPTDGYLVLWRVAGSGGSYTPAGPFTSSPAVFTDGGNPEGTQYEGYIYSDCGDGVTGTMIPWSTGAESVYGIALASPCVGIFSNFIITGGTPGDSVTVRAQFNGMLQKTAGLFTRADLTMVAVTTDSDSSPCYTDTTFHSFTVIVDITFTMTGTTQAVTTNAVVNNASASPTSLTVSIIDVNGTPISRVSAAGCTGNSSTGGTC